MDRALRRSMSRSPRRHGAPHSPSRGAHDPPWAFKGPTISNPFVNLCDLRVRSFSNLL